MFKLASLVNHFEHKGEGCIPESTYICHEGNQVADLLSKHGLNIDPDGYVLINICQIHLGYTLLKSEFFNEFNSIL